MSCNVNCIPRFPKTKGVAGHVATTGETLNIADAYHDERFNRYKPFNSLLLYFLKLLNSFVKLRDWIMVVLRAFFELELPYGF